MNGITAYQENKVTTQSNGRLVVMLYEGAIKFLKQAIVEIEAQNWAQKGVFINKAAAIIEELNVTLDMEVGGEVATNLRSLYLFMLRHLTQANFKRDPQMLREVIDLLNDLLGAWKAIA